MRFTAVRQSSWSAILLKGRPFAGLAAAAPQYPIPERKSPAACDASRGLIGLSVVVLAVSFFTPIWHYNFTAPLYPEYPEGLPMTVYINRLGGRIDLVNALNHYIGMRTISSSDLIALKAMPWLIALLCAGGLAVVAWGRDRLWPRIAWMSAFAAICLVLLGDFYWWLYSCGHDLNPHAAIRIAPFTPPLLGSYTVLSAFHVMSWPGPGGIAMVLSFGLGFAALMMQLFGLYPPGGKRAKRLSASQYPCVAPARPPAQAGVSARETT